MNNKTLLLTLLILVCANVFSQNIEFKITAEYLSNYTSIDSLIIENITNQTKVSLNNFSEKQTYIININKGTITHSEILKNEQNQNLFKIRNYSPGKMHIQNLNERPSNIGIKLFNTSGQIVMEKKSQYIEPGSCINIELGKTGIYLVYLFNENGFQTFKMLGNPNLIQSYIDIQYGSVSLKQQILSNDKYYFEPGDSLKIQAFKLNLYSDPIFLKATESTDLHFVFDSLTPLFYFLDERDSATYKASKIGKQIWMAENLAYETPVGSLYYKSKQENLTTYGRLYNWATAKSACPAGWYLPEFFEWQELIDYAGQKPCTKLKSTWGWYEEQNGTDDFNFCALPGGFATERHYFFYIKEDGKWWTASTDIRDTLNARHVRLYYNTDDISNIAYTNKEYFYSVRCLKRNIDLSIITDSLEQIHPTEVTLKGNLTLPNLTRIDQMGFYWSPTNKNPTKKDSIILVTPTNGKFEVKLQQLAVNTSYYVRSFAITSKGNVWGNVLKFKTIKESFIDERDGQQYDIMKIGSTTWMAENLAFKADSNSWAYNDDEKNVALYGRLYNWETAKTACPQNWHLPSYDEWRSLAEYVNDIKGPFQQYTNEQWAGLGTYLNADWSWQGQQSTNNGIDAFGFSALAAGYRASNKTFYDLGKKGNWWTIDFNENSLARSTTISYLGSVFYLNRSFIDNGLSVRCVQDYDQPSATTLTATEKTYESVVLNGKINNSGFEITECGFYWSQKNKNPNSSDSVSYAENKSGNISVALTNLIDFAPFYYRIFVKYQNGEVLGDVLSFTTPYFPTPVAITYDATEVTTNSAQLNGNINFLNSRTAPIIERGFYWSDKNSYNNLYNNVLSVEGETGNYNGTLEHLTPNTTYYFAAFVTTKKGNHVGHTDSLKTKAISGSTITDLRDGKTYKTVIIGNQMWMAENLSFKTESGSWTYNNKEENAPTYGRLYNWETALQACPKGWHLPDYHEWEDLAVFIGSNAGLKLKSTTGWNGDQNGSDEYGFAALPGGVNNGSDYFTGLTTFAEWWSSTLRTGNELAYTMVIRNGDKDLLLSYESVASDLGNSIRCIKGYDQPEITTIEATFIDQTSAILNGMVTSRDNISVLQRGFYLSNVNPTPNKNDQIIIVEGDLGSYFALLNQLTPNSTYYFRSYANYTEGTVLGEVSTFKTAGGNQGELLFDSRDGNQYKTVKIGNQTWMAENLSYNIYPGSYSYNNKEVNDSIYGKLYNWESAQSACPAAWHLPTDKEWERMIEYINQEIGPFVKSNDDWEKVGKYVKAGWNWGGNAGSDKFGFAALPGGLKNQSQYFSQGNNGYWWTATSGEDNSAWGRHLKLESDNLFRVYYNKSFSASIRCVKD